MKTLPKEHRILLHPREVRGLLDGQATVVVKPVDMQPAPIQVLARDAASPSGYSYTCDTYGDFYIPDQYGAPGDLLWVAEPFEIQKLHGSTGTCVAYATDCLRLLGSDTCPVGIHKSPPLLSSTFSGWHVADEMPRWASRFLLPVVSKSIVRLHSTPEDVLSKLSLPPNYWGKPTDPVGLLRARLEFMWRTFYHKDNITWEDNPVVWVIEHGYPS